MALVTTLPPLPPRPIDGHKGLFGRVLIVGGDEGMIGAPVMAGTAALRTGAGLVQIAVPRTILTAALSITPELIGIGLGKGEMGDDSLPWIARIASRLDLAADQQHQALDLPVIDVLDQGEPIWTQLHAGWQQAEEEGS